VQARLRAATLHFSVQARLRAATLHFNVQARLRAATLHFSVQARKEAKPQRKKALSPKTLFTSPMTLGSLLLHSAVCPKDSPKGIRSGLRRRLCVLV
jgi:hypothetical protein